MITTYNMIAHSGKRSRASQAVLDKIRHRVWGIVLLDEVHVVPSDMFRRVVEITRFHTALGLTATLVREDEKIADLGILIGPKVPCAGEGPGEGGTVLHWACNATEQ